MALSQQARRRKRNLNAAFGLKQEIISHHANHTFIKDQAQSTEELSTEVNQTIDSAMDRSSPSVGCPTRTTMEDILASIPGFDKKVKRKKTSKKLTTAERLAQTREGCLDLETPNSILVHANMRMLLNKHTFGSLPELYQQKLIALLPEVDKLEADGGKMRISGTSLTNEFFTRASMKWRERLAEGELTAESRQKQKAEAERERSRLDPWKVKNFEPFWGYQQPKKDVNVRITRKRKSSESNSQVDDTKKTRALNENVLGKIFGIAVSPEPATSSESDVILMSSPSPTLSNNTSTEEILPKMTSVEPKSKVVASKKTVKKNGVKRCPRKEIREIELVDGEEDIMKAVEKAAESTTQKPVTIGKKEIVKYDIETDDDDKPLSSLVPKTDKRSPKPKSESPPSPMRPKRVYPSKRASSPNLEKRQPLLRKATLPAPPPYDDDIYYADSVFKKPASRAATLPSSDSDAGKNSSNSVPKKKVVQWEEPVDNGDERLKLLYGRSDTPIQQEIAGSDSDESVEEMRHCTFFTSLSVSQPSNYGEDASRKRSPLILKIRANPKSEEKSQFILPRLSIEIPTDTEANASTTDSDLHDTSFESTTTSESAHTHGDDSEIESETEAKPLFPQKGRGTPTLVSRPSESQSSAFLNYVTTEEPKHSNLFLQIQSEIEKERLEERRKLIQMRHQAEAERLAAMVEVETEDKNQESASESYENLQVQFELEDSVEMPIVNICPSDSSPDYEASKTFDEVDEDLKGDELTNKKDDAADSCKPASELEDDAENITSDELNISFQSLGSPGSASISPFLQDDELREIEANCHEGASTLNASSKVCSADDILDCLQQKQSALISQESRSKLVFSERVAYENAENFSELHSFQEKSKILADNITEVTFPDPTDKSNTFDADNRFDDGQSADSFKQSEADLDEENFTQVKGDDFQTSKQTCFEDRYSYESQTSYSEVQMDISFETYQDFSQEEFNNSDYIVMGEYQNFSDECNSQKNNPIDKSGDLLNQAVSVIDNAAGMKEDEQTQSNDSEEAEKALVNQRSMPSITTQGQMAILQVGNVPTCHPQVLTTTTTVNSSVIPVVQGSIQIATSELRLNSPKPRSSVPLLPKPGPLATKQVLPPSRSYGRASKTPPGTVNLERSYQICKAVIQSSPNCRQLENQLKPPSIPNKEARMRAVTSSEKAPSVLMVNSAQRPLAPRLPSVNEHNVRPTAIVMPTPTVQPKLGNEQPRQRAITTEVSISSSLPQSAATPVIVGPGGILVQQSQTPIVLSLPPRSESQPQITSQVTVLNQAPRELAPTPVQQQPRLLQIQTSMPSTSEAQSTDKVNIIVLNSVPQAESSVVQILGASSSSTLVHGTSAPLLIPNQTRPMITTAPLVGVMQDGALKILQVNTSLGTEQVITQPKQDSNQAVILTSPMQQTSQFIIQNTSQMNNQPVIIRMQGPPTSQPGRFQAPQAHSLIRLATPGPRQVNPNDAIRHGERFRFEEPRWTPRSMHGQLPQPQRVASAPLPPNVRLVQPSVQNEQPLRAASVPDQQNYRLRQPDRVKFDGYHSDYQQIDTRYYQRNNLYENQFNNYEQNIEIKCECRVTAWAMCVKCGAFSHGDCMTASQICSSCLVK
ncbi:polycomb group protein Asx-like isoform X2 [Artemia franciscana]|uniref:polycomb group protein Asx-like isoform X2 n=1 Tax=Artemia franciscana TaxID=6661 RepID=UPI0032D9DE2A